MRGHRLAPQNVQYSGSALMRTLHGGAEELPKLPRVCLTTLCEYMTLAAKTHSFLESLKIPRFHRCLDVSG